MFTGNANKGFGFGSTAGSGNLFGSSTANNSTGFGFGAKPGGLFGATTSAPSFGTSTSGGLFSNNNSGGGLFGAPTTVAQPASSGGLFGQQGNTAFGKPATSNAFGASSGFGGGTGLFGATSTTTAGGGLFGVTQSTTTGNRMFSGSGAFGSTAATGTASTKFQPTDGQDNMMKNGLATTVKTKHYCITGMKAYEAKSLEELRLEDYAAGLKGPKAAGAATTGGGMFGGAQPAATGFGGFGATPASSASGFAFGATSQASTPFGGLNKPAGGGLFGSTAPTTGGLFGQTSSAGTAFGSTPATGQTGGLFGSTAAKPNPFGTTGTFGQTAPAFGQTSSATTGFGAFGAKPTTGFGAITTSASTGFGFGMQNTATTGFGGFGAKPTTGFGAQPAAGTGTLGGFGTLGQTTGAFGLAKPTTGFGATTTGFSTGLSGLGAATAQQPQQPVQLASNLDLQTQQAMVQQQIFALANSPYGDSPLFRNIRKDRKEKPDIIPTDPAAQKTLLTSSGSKLKVSSRPAAKVKLTNISNVQAIGTAHNKSELFEGLDDDGCYTPEKYGARRSVKKLVIRPSPAASGGSSRITAGENRKGAFSSPSLYSNHNRSAVEMTNPLGAEETFDLSGVDKVKRPPVSNLYPSLDLDDTIGELQANGRAADIPPSKLSPRETKPMIGETYAVSPVSPYTPSPRHSNRDSQVQLSVSKREHADVSASQALPNETGVLEEDKTTTPHPCGVICTRTDYYTIPSLDELPDYLDDKGDCYVDNLSIGREGYGSVFFPGYTNVAGLDIDRIVHFRRKEVTIYPDDDDKPPENEGLNKRAEVTLDCVWPNEKSTRSPIKSPERLRLMNYQDKIEAATSRIGAKFIDYRPDTGSWVFEVKHFSKYGLLDDDSDDDNIQPYKSPAADVKRLKALHLQNTSVQAQKMHVTEQAEKLASGDSVASRSSLTVGTTGTVPSSATNYLRLNSSAEDVENRMPLDVTNDLSSQEVNLVPVSHLLASQCGVHSSSIQRMKASFLGMDDDDDFNTSATSLAQRKLLEGSPSIPLFKKGSMLDSVTPLSQSPLVRSSKIGLSPSLDKLSSSFFKSEAKLESNKSDPLLKSNRMSTDITVPEPDYISLPSGMEIPLKPRVKIQGLRLQLSRIPLKKSILHKNGRCIIDAGCKEGRRSRVGWGPKMTLAHNGKHSVFDSDSAGSDRPEILSNKFSILSPARTRPTSCHQVNLESSCTGTQAFSSDALVIETKIKALKVQLAHTDFSGMEEGSPKVTPQPGIAALHSYGRESLNDLDAAVASQCDSEVLTMFRHNILVWELMVALWGSLPEFEHIDDLDIDSYLYQNARSEAFSRWLSYSANYYVQQETTKKAQKTNGVTAAIFSHLTARQIPEAAKLAIENKDLRLALLLSQAGTCQDLKTLLNKQLCDWNKTMADKYISDDRFKLYVLLSGTMVWENATQLTNCCVDLDWKRALAIHYWYSPAKMNINASIAHYDAAWKEDTDCGGYAAPPLPLYMEDTEVIHSDCKDTCYHLLKLYSNSSYRLDELLSSASSTCDPLDYHLSWHLMQVLYSLNYTHLEPHQAAAIHTRYAEQLESCGLWEWAVLPLLNLPSPHIRKKLVKDLLLRNVRLNITESDNSDLEIMSTSDDMDTGDSSYLGKEKFVLEQLHVPEKWLHEVKAIKSRCEGLHEEEAWHLLHSDQLNPAHKIVLLHIAPQLIVNDDLDSLHSYLDKLQQSCDSVSGWMTGGKIYLDYITIYDVVNDLRQKSGEADGYSIEKLKPEVKSLGRRLLSLATPTPMHCLAQSTMALHTVQHMKFVMSLDKENTIENTGTLSSRYVAEPFSQLPLQSDDSVILLKETMSSFMLEY